MSELVTVSEVARMLGVPPRAISDRFYARELDDERCPIVAGRRLIPRDYVAAIRDALAARAAEGKRHAAP